MADAIKEDIRAASHLAEATKKTLESRVNRFYTTETFPKHIIKRVIPSITANESSKLAYLQSILSISRISEPFKKAVGAKQLRDVLKEAELLKEREMERRDKGERRPNDIDWGHILMLNLKFPIGSEARLVYLLYTCLPPVRADYTPMEIVESPRQANDPQMNYYVRARKPYILLNVYKTAGKYGQQRLEVPSVLAEAIPVGQRYMFEFNGHPMTANTLSKKVVRAFQRYTGLHVSINTLRRSYALMTMKLSKDAQVDAAITQGHSLSVHKEYSMRG